MVWRERGDGWRDLLGLTTALLVLVSSRLVTDMAGQVRMGSLRIQEQAPLEQMWLGW